MKRKLNNLWTALMFAGILLLVTSGVASAIRYEAEDAELIGVAYSVDDSAASNGKVVCCLEWPNVISSGVRFNNMPATNSFLLQYSTGGASTGKYNVSLYINDVFIRYLVPVSTGDWPIYNIMEVTGITVNEGESISIIRDNIDGQYGFNIDYIEYYSWTGFFEPIDNDAVNLVKGGSAIPVKFSLDGDQGLDIFMSGYPQSIAVDCGGAPVDSITPDETDTAGQSGLSYDPLADQYVYVWKTNKDWKSGCRQLQVMLNTGQIYSAIFKFEK